MMYCSVCRKHVSDTQKSNSFIAGTKNLKLEAVKDHELSKCHILVQKIAMDKSASEDSPAMKDRTAGKDDTIIQECPRNC